MCLGRVFRHPPPPFVLTPRPIIAQRKSEHPHSVRTLYVLRLCYTAYYLLPFFFPQFLSDVTTKAILFTIPKPLISVLYYMKSTYSG